METVVTILVVVAAAAFVGWKVFHAAGGDGGCSCGCDASKCPSGKAGCCSGHDADH